MLQKLPFPASCIGLLNRESAHNNEKQATLQPLETSVVPRRFVSRYTKTYINLYMGILESLAPISSLNLFHLFSTVNPSFSSWYNSRTLMIVERE